MAQLQTIENLARVTNDGRLQPWLAHDWSVSSDGRSVASICVRREVSRRLTVDRGNRRERREGQLCRRPWVRRSATSRVCRATSDRQIVIRLHRPSPFLLEALEVPVPKPGTSLVGTGPFKVDNPQSPTEMRANDDYYLGKPTIGRIVVTSYPSVRAAWAEMLRGQLDMLYEVGADALDSLEASSKISTFTFVRRYQYAVVMNNQSDVFRSKAFRQAVNYAIDRDAIVRDGLERSRRRVRQPGLAVPLRLHAGARASATTSTAPASSSPSPSTRSPSLHLSGPARRDHRTDRADRETPTAAGRHRDVDRGGPVRRR